MLGTIIEGLMVLLVILGFVFEKKLIMFEDKIITKIKKKTKERPTNVFKS